MSNIQNNDLVFKHADGQSQYEFMLLNVYELSLTHKIF